MWADTQPSLSHTTHWSADQVYCSAIGTDHMIIDWFDLCTKGGPHLHPSSIRIGSNECSSLFTSSCRRQTVCSLILNETVQTSAGSFRAWDRVPEVASLASAHFACQLLEVVLKCSKWSHTWFPAQHSLITFWLDCRNEPCKHQRGHFRYPLFQIKSLLSFHTAVY